jgi:hypothetical protein
LEPVPKQTLEVGFPFSSVFVKQCKIKRLQTEKDSATAIKRFIERTPEHRVTRTSFSNASDKTGSKITAREHARSGSDTSTASTYPFFLYSTSPLQAVAILPLGDFHEVSRAAGPKRH